MENNLEKYCSLEEISMYMGVSKDTLRKWIKNTDIPAHRIGRQWRFKKSEIDSWIRSGKSANL